MKILLVGRADHDSHPTIQKLIELTENGKKIVDFVDKESFLKVDISEYDMVCLKWAYYFPEVWEKLKNHPEIVVVNSQSATEICQDRRKIQDYLDKEGIRSPHFARNEKEVQYLDYPIIVKSIDAENHEMNVYQNFEDLPKIDLNKYIYQEMIPNDGYDYKCYGLGNIIHCLRRKASQAVHHSKKLAEGRELIEMESESKTMTRKIGKAMGLDVFGVDYLKHTETGKYYAIDVNIFPGFIGVPKAEIHWLEYLKKKIEKKTKND